MTETRCLTVGEQIEELMHAGPKWMEPLRPTIRRYVIAENRSTNGDLAPFKDVVTALPRTESSDSRAHFDRILTAVVEYLEHRGQQPATPPPAVEIWLYGRHVGKREFLLRLLRKRFGELPGWVPLRLDTAEPEQLERWGDRLLDVDNLGALFDIE